MKIFTRFPRSQLLVLVLFPCYIFAQETGYADNTAEAQQQLRRVVETIDSETLDFIQRWSQTATDCNNVYNSIFGNLKKPCRAIRAGLRRGELLIYQQQCLNKGITGLDTVIEAQRQISGNKDKKRLLESLLIDLEQSLLDTCSFDKFLPANPVFSALLDDARIAQPVNFDTFGPMDSMAWWNPVTDPANTGNAMTSNIGTLPVILGE